LHKYLPGFDGRSPSAAQGIGRYVVRNITDLTCCGRRWNKCVFVV